MYTVRSEKKDKLIKRGRKEGVEKEKGTKVRQKERSEVMSEGSGAIMTGGRKGKSEGGRVKRKGEGRKGEGGGGSLTNSNDSQHLKLMRSGGFQPPPPYLNIFLSYFSHSFKHFYAWVRNKS